jgi:hypothetical protein
MEINMDPCLLWTLALREVAGRDPRTLTEDEFYVRFGNGSHRIFNWIERMIRTMAG